MLKKYDLNDKWFQKTFSIFISDKAKTEKMKNMSKNIYDDDGEYEEYQYSYLTVPTKEFKETLVDEGGGRMSIFVRPNLPDYDEVPDGRVPRIPRHGPIVSFC